MCGLSCPAACGILVPRAGIKLTSPTLESRFLITEPSRRSPFIGFSDLNGNLALLAWKDQGCLPSPRSLAVHVGCWRGDWLGLLSRVPAHGLSVRCRLLTAWWLSSKEEGGKKWMPPALSVSRPRTHSGTATTLFSWSINLVSRRKEINSTTQWERVTDFAVMRNPLQIPRDNTLWTGFLNKVLSDVSDHKKGHT